MKTGALSGMKESDTEGLALHSVPESCGSGGNSFAEALTGARTGPVLSPEIGSNFPGADHLLMMGRLHTVCRNGKAYRNPAGSETWRMCGNNARGNRETLLLALTDCTKVRMANSKEIRPR